VEYTLQWIGEVFLGVSTDAGRHVGLTLLKGHPVPAEFKEGDRVLIEASKKIPYEPEVETEHRAYFTVTHIATGKTLSVWHETDQWMLDKKA
jgi:hypothetical protein